MKTRPEHDACIANMTFATAYPYYVTKVEKKGRNKKELDKIIEWLTAFDEKKIQKLFEKTFKVSNFAKKYG